MRFVVFAFLLISILSVSQAINQSIFINQAECADEVIDHLGKSLVPSAKKVLEEIAGLNQTAHDTSKEYSLRKDAKSRLYNDISLFKIFRSYPYLIEEGIIGKEGEIAIGDYKLKMSNFRIEGIVSLLEVTLFDSNNEVVDLNPLPFYSAITVTPLYNVDKYCSEGDCGYNFLKYFFIKAYIYSHRDSMPSSFSNAYGKDWMPEALDSLKRIAELNRIIDENSSAFEVEKAQAELNKIYLDPIFQCYPDLVRDKTFPSEDGTLRMGNYKIQIVGYQINGTWMVDISLGIALYDKNGAKKDIGFLGWDEASINITHENFTLEKIIEMAK